MSELNRKKLFQLIEQIPENSQCADCGQENPDWASYNIGVFLCKHCSSIHRGLGAHISRVKSVKLDNWDRTQLSCMEEIGNAKAHEKCEKYVPNYYRRPMPNDPLVLREQWIRAKYERKEFMQPLDTTYSKGNLEGFLMKRGKEDGKFAPRLFMLDYREGTLRYYVKQNDKKPKTSIKVLDLNVAFCPKKIHPNGMQFMYLKDGKTRSIFVYSEDQKTTIDWYMAIRAAKLLHMSIAYPNTPVEDLLDYLTCDFIMEGFLDKTGPRASDAYRRRYFVLDERKLMYLNNPMDAYANGEILLGTKDEGFAVKKGIEENLKAHIYGFMLVTPERKWLFGASDENDREEWINALNSIIEKPPVPQDQSVNLRSHLRNSYAYKKRSSGNSSRSMTGSSSGSSHDTSSFISTLSKKFFRSSDNSQ